MTSFARKNSTPCQKAGIFKQPQEPPSRFPAHFLQFPRIVGGGVGLFFRRSDDWVDLRGKATKQFGYFRDYFFIVLPSDNWRFIQNSTNKNGADCVCGERSHILPGEVRKIIDSKVPAGMGYGTVPRRVLLDLHLLTWCLVAQVGSGLDVL